MANAHFSVQLLGSPSLTWCGRPFQVARRQARALLYRLAGSLQAVPRQEIGFLFWADETESQARRNLNRLLSYLHASLPQGEMLLLGKNAVQVNPELVQSDARRFERMCTNGSVESVQEAVTLYRGDFLEGFYLPNSPEYDFWLTEERARYERLYLSGLSKLVEAHIKAGEYLQAIPYALKCLELDSLAEEMHRSLIVCFAATGRRAAAQAQYEQMVVTLERELGVKPLPETIASYQSSLRGDLPAAHTVPAPESWSILPALHVPMLGRREAWQQLQAAHQNGRSGCVILVSGEAGIGKSRLLMEFATSDHKVVLNGNSHPGTQNLSYQPVIQALQLALQNEWLWEGISPLWLAEVSPLVPQIVERYPDLPERVTLAPQQSQARLFEALTQVLLGLAGNTAPLLLCLDDLQWADAMTIEWLKYLAPRVPGSKLCILATCRSERAQELAELRRALNRSGALHEIELGGLQQGAIEEMVSACGAAELIPLSAVPRLQQVTGGNPFFLLEILSAILESDTPVEADSIPITRSIHTLVETRLDRLTMVARQVLEASAVLSPRLEMELIGSTSGRQEFELAEALDELARHHFLKTENERHAFRHELIRSAIYQGLSQWRRQLLHKRAAHAFEAVYQTQLAGEIAQVAAHYDQAAQPEQAVRCYHAAAEHAVSIHAIQSAIQHIQRALELLPAAGQEAASAVQIHELLGDCLSNTGDFPQARQSYNLALEALGKGQPLSEACLLRKCAAAYGGEYAYDEAVPLLEKALQALEAQPDSKTNEWQHCWLDVQLERIWIFYLKAMPEVIDEISSRIRPVIERSGTPLHRIRFLTGLNYGIVRKNRYRVSEELVEWERRALSIAEEVEDEALICERQFNTGILSLLHGDAEAGVQYLSAGLELSQKIGLLPIELQCLVYLIAAYRRQGETEQVRRLLPRCSEAARLVGQPNYLGASLAHQAWLEQRDGEPARANELGLQALELWDKTKTYPFQWIGLWLLLELAHTQGELEQALQHALRLVDPMQQAVPDEIEVRLQAALNAAAQEQPKKAQSELEEALNLARRQGYL